MHPFTILALPFTKITEISLGFLSIKIWGLLVAFAMLSGLAVAYFEAKRKKVSFDLIFDLFIWIFIASMLGGRLFYVFLFWRDFLASPLRIFYVWEGGLVFYGGVIGAVLAVYIILRKHKTKFWKIADVLAPGVALGIFIGRIGCYLTGLHIGAKTNFFLASEYNGELRHEPSLYLSLNGLIMFMLLMFLRKKLRKEGYLTWVFLLWYGVSRFIIDFFRASDLPGNLSDPRFFGLTISQYLSLAILIVMIPWGYKKFLAK